MALTVEFLEGLGLDKEAVKKITDAHAETIAGLTGFKTKAEKLQKDLDTAKAELDKVKKDSEKKDESLSELDRLKEDFENYKNDIATKESRRAKKDAYKTLLDKAGIPSNLVNNILEISTKEIDALELDEANDIKDPDTLIDGIKTKWAGFIPKKQIQGANTPKPPQENGGKTLAKSDIMKIKDTAERQQAWKDYLNNGGK